MRVVKGKEWWLGEEGKGGGMGHGKTGQGGEGRGRSWGEGVEGGEEE